MYSYNLHVDLCIYMQICMYLATRDGGGVREIESGEECGWRAGEGGEGRVGRGEGGVGLHLILDWWVQGIYIPEFVRKCI